MLGVIPFSVTCHIDGLTRLQNTHNSLEPRTRGAIALGMMGNNSSGCVLLALDSGKLIRRAHAKIIPMTAEVIARVNHLGRDESTLFTFTNRRGEEVGERTLNRIEGSNDEAIEHEVHNVWTLSMTSQEWIVHTNRMSTNGTTMFRQMATMPSIKTSQARPITKHNRYRQSCFRGWRDGV